MKPALALFASLLIGCAHAPAMPTPAADWRELASPHVLLRTDASETEARLALEELEITAGALLHVAELGVPRERLEIVLFATERDYHDLRDEKWSGGHFRVDELDLEPSARVVLFISLGQGVVATLPSLLERMQHEIGHWIVHGAMPRPPLWLDEGLAMWLATLRRDPDAPEGVIGAPASLVTLDRFPPAGEVLAADAATFYGPRRDVFYSAAWGLVETLRKRHPDRMARLIAAERAGRSESALREAGIEAAELDRELRDELSHDVPRGMRVALPPTQRSEPEWSKRLDEVVRDVLIARLLPWETAADRERVRSLLDAAEQARPGEPEIEYWLSRLATASGQPVKAIEHARAVVEERPDDVRGQALLVNALLQAQRSAPAADVPPELAPAIDRLLALAVRPVDFEVAAIGRRAQHRLDDALALTDRALALDGACWYCQVTRSQILEEQGRPDEAARAVEAALAHAPEHVADRIARRLDLLRRAAKPGIR